MKQGTACILHIQDFTCTKQPIEVHLRNGRMINGVIIGIYADGQETDEQHITGFHIVNENDHLSSGVDALGFLKGEIIYIHDIVQLKMMGT